MVASSSQTFPTEGSVASFYWLPIVSELVIQLSAATQAGIAAMSLAGGENE